MKRCSVCGFTFDDIIRTKSIGCPNCYETYKEEFHNSLAQLNIKTIYKDTVTKKDILLDKAILLKKMKKAVESENYEKAAVYRDCLKALSNDSEN